MHAPYRRLTPAAVVVLVGLLSAACGGSGEQVLTADPLPTVPVELRPPTTSPNPTATPPPTPTPTPTPRPSVPTDSERAAFVADYRPTGATGLDHVAIDLTGDGTEELVFTYVRQSSGRAHIDVAAWRPTGYEVVFRDDGGLASRIDRLSVDDINGDGALEIATFQSGPQTSSISLWRAGADGSVEPLVARGGCSGGSHTYGTTGARLEDRTGAPGSEVVADCGPGRSDLYAWQAGGYTYTETLGQPTPAGTYSSPGGL